MTFKEILKQATKEMLADIRQAEYYKFRNNPLPWDIACGWCEEWCNRVIELNGGKGEVWWIDELMKCSPEDCVAHCVLKYRGKYYDAECHDGVINWRDLPIMRPDGNPRPGSKNG